MRNAGAHQGLFETARQEGAAIEDGDLLPPRSLGVASEHLLDDADGLGLGVAVGDDLDFVARLLSRVECLAETFPVASDHRIGGGEYVSGRTEILFEPDPLSARKVLMKAANVLDVGAPPSINRLIVVADAEDASMLCRERL
jgi:hypothetical protein